MIPAKLKTAGYIIRKWHEGFYNPAYLSIWFLNGAGSHDTKEKLLPLTVGWSPHQYSQQHSLSVDPL